MKTKSLLFELLYAAAAIAFPLLLARLYLGFGTWDLTVPLLYGSADHIWQLALNKVLFDTGWILNNPFLGAPDIASWHHNAAAQTSALHSILELTLKPFVKNAVQMQQLYYFLNFPLITLITFYCCRMTGVSEIPALSAGILFSFTRFRIDEMLYTYLPNYFCVPLVLVSIIWISTGKFKSLFADHGNRPSAQIARKKNWALWTVGLLFVVIASIADGYYSFFALMLLGISVLFRIVMGDWKRPVSLLPGVIYMLTLLAVAIALQTPLDNYKKNHRQEFFPEGVEDAVYAKKPFEAEVYSSSLKLLIAPDQHHRIEALANLGQQMVSSSDDARKYQRGNYWPLGLLASITLLVTLFRLALPKTKTQHIESLQTGPAAQAEKLKDVLPLLIFFSFLASIAGGLGTIVALVFPTIRAYDRFAVYLFLSLLILAADFATGKLAKLQGLTRLRWILAIILITILALLDQIPADAYKGDETTKAKFISERNLINKIELALPVNSMIYQYPHSQYLSDNKYYGWGSFAHIRFYLHSKTLRWSNGGSKNSPVENWHLRQSKRSITKLVSTMTDAGFKAIIFDKLVISPLEYQHVLTEVAKATENPVIEDKESGLSYIFLQDRGYHVNYQKDYQAVSDITITDLAKVQKYKSSDRIDKDMLLELASKKTQEYPMRLSPMGILVGDEGPGLGSGEIKVKTPSDVKGSLSCGIGKKQLKTTDNVTLTISNSSVFDWEFDNGRYPLRIGVQILGLKGQILQWDDGTRVRMGNTVGPNETVKVSFDLKNLKLSSLPTDNPQFKIKFTMLQEGNVWFNPISCTVDAIL